MLALSIAGCSNAPAATPDTGSNASNITAAAAPASAGKSAGDNPAAISKEPAGTGTGSTAGNNTAATRQQAVKFAECMRANGVKGFPDPDASGQLTIDSVANGSSLDTNSPAFKQALSACKDLEPAGFTGQKRSAQQQEAALKFAQCIRDSGVKDFPDPAPDAPLVDTDRIPSANKPGGMSALNAAMKKCGGMAAQAGVSGSR
jgi:hypothetical protein